MWCFVAISSARLVDSPSGEDMQRIAQYLVLPRGGAEAAQWPGGALPGGVGAKFLLKFRRGHTFIIVPGAVVGAHVLQTEPPVLAQLAVFARRAATGQVTAPPRSGRVGRVSPGSDRSARHGLTMTARVGDWQWRNLLVSCDGARKSVQPRRSHFGDPDRRFRARDVARDG